MRSLLRALLALLLIAALVAVAVFFADRPGQVVVVWQGWRIETSVGVVAAGAALLIAAAAMLALLIAAALRLPRNLRRRRLARRRQAGEAALIRGVVALAAGQAAAARHEATRARSLLPAAPIPLLLLAEAAARQGDAAAARTAYTDLLELPDGEFLALRGLIGQALRDGDDDTARRLAERAGPLRRDAAWPTETLLALQARAGDWRAARQTLAQAARRHLVPAARLHHHQGVVLYELSRGAEQAGDLRQAAKLAARAHKLAPDLTVATAQQARLLLALGHRRAAARAVERAWRTAPHPELARLYRELDPAAGKLAQAAAATRLAALQPEAVDGQLAAGDAALTAQLWGEARHHLERAAAAAPQQSRRLCRLMARLEEGESGNAGAARLWLDRALAAPPEPCYVCARCGGSEPQWQPLCRHCGAFDMLAWRPPPPNGATPPPVSPIAPGVELGSALMPPGPATPERAAPQSTVPQSTVTAASGLASPAQSDI